MPRYYLPGVVVISISVVWGFAAWVLHDPESDPLGLAGVPPIIALVVGVVLLVIGIVVQVADYVVRGRGTAPGEPALPPEEAPRCVSCSAELNESWLGADGGHVCRWCGAITRVTADTRNRGRQLSDTPTTSN